MIDLTQYGFQYIGHCNCNGTKTLKYKKSVYIIYYIKKKDTFHLKHLNNYLVKNQPASTICEQLKYHGVIESQEFSNTN